MIDCISPSPLRRMKPKQRHATAARRRPLHVRFLEAWPTRTARADPRTEPGLRTWTRWCRRWGRTAARRPPSSARRGVASNLGSTPILGDGALTPEAHQVCGQPLGAGGSDLVVHRLVQQQHGVLVLEVGLLVELPVQIRPEGLAVVEPGRGIGERVGVLLSGDLEDRQHAAGGGHVPGADGGRGGVGGHAGGVPELQLLLVRARGVATGDEGDLAALERLAPAGDAAEGLSGRGRGGDAGGVVLGADDGEVVVGEREPQRGDAVREELLLVDWRVHDEHVGEAVDEQPGWRRRNPRTRYSP